MVTAFDINKMTTFTPRNSQPKVTDVHELNSFAVIIVIVSIIDLEAELPLINIKILATLASLSLVLRAVLQSKICQAVGKLCACGPGLGHV